MKNKFIYLSLLMFVYAPNHAQVMINRDTDISNMVTQVNTDSLRSYINTLVAFGTRNTLSTQTSKVRGIGAARNWVLAKFNQFATKSGGRLTAFIDTTTSQPDKRRVDTILLLGNVVATLKGTDPNDK